MKVIKLADPLYGQGIMLIISSAEQFEGYMWQHFKLREETQCSINAKTNWIINTESGRFFVYIWMPEWDGLPFNYEILSHELIHAMCAIYKHVGTSVDNDNQEPTAYYYSNLYGQAIQKLSRLCKKKPAKKRK